MQFISEGINVDEVVKAIASEPEIEDVHHIHIWKLDDNHIHLEAHQDFNKEFIV